MTSRAQGTSSARCCGCSRSDILRERHGAPRCSRCSGFGTTRTSAVRNHVQESPWLRTRSDSVWPVVLAHFAHNATFAWIGSALLLTDHPVLVDEYLAGDTGLFVLIGTLACLLVIAVASRRARRRVVQKQAT